MHITCHVMRHLVGSATCLVWPSITLSLLLLLLFCFFPLGAFRTWHNGPNYSISKMSIKGDLWIPMSPQPRNKLRLSLNFAQWVLRLLCSRSSRFLGSSCRFPKSVLFKQARRSSWFLLGNAAPLEFCSTWDKAKEVPPVLFNSCGVISFNSCVRVKFGRRLYYAAHYSAERKDRSLV